MVEIKLSVDTLLPYLRRSSATPPTAPPNAQPAGLETPDDEEVLTPGRVDDDIWGCTFMIEYRAASGARSMRRVTARTMSVSSTRTVTLGCYCHERKALRTFRLDRIIKVIDFDGVVHEPAAFFADELQMHIPDAAFVERPGTAGAAAVPGRAQRLVARAGLRALCALARADGVLHPAEVEVILDYVSWRADAEQIDTTEVDRAALVAYIRRQRPTDDVLAECLADLAAEPPDLQRLFLRHAIALAEADGVHDGAEFELLVQLRETLG